MALVIADRVRDTTTTTGTGALTLADSPPSTYQSFGAVCAADDTVWYCIQHQSADEWEVGLGTSNGTTGLTRTTVYASSNAGAAVNFSAGTKDVFLVFPAEEIRPASAMRDKLTANRTYYVRTDGSNSNDGLTDSAGGAWLTWDYAADFVVANLDLAGYDCTIQCGGTGSRTFSNATISLLPWVGGGHLKFIGNATTPSEVVWDGTGTKLTATLGTGTLTVQGFTISSSNGYGINFNGNAGRLDVRDVVWGACNNSQLILFSGVIKEYTVTISGGAQSHIYASGPTVFYEHGVSGTISGTPAFSTAFLRAELAAILSDYGGWTNAANATGVRYTASSNAIINTFGSGATYLPGDTAGSVETQGQYI